MYTSARVAEQLHSPLHLRTPHQRQSKEESHLSNRCYQGQSCCLTPTNVGRCVHRGLRDPCIRLLSCALQQAVYPSHYLLPFPSSVIPCCVAREWRREERERTIENLSSPSRVHIASRHARSGERCTHRASLDAAVAKEGTRDTKSRQKMLPGFAGGRWR